MGDPSGGQAGDGVGGDDGGLPCGVVGAASFDLAGLGAAGEGQARTDGPDLHAADLAASVPGLVSAVVEDGLALGQSLEPAQQCGLVALDDVHVVPSGSDNLPGVLVLSAAGCRR